MSTSLIHFVPRSRHLPHLASLIATAFLAFLGQTTAAIIPAASASLAAVTSAIALASDGDTVIVPAGTGHWTSTLAITKGITLQGATTTTGAGTTSPTVADATIILDDVPITTANNAINLYVTLTPNQTFRLTGFTFRHGSRATMPINFGCVRIEGTCPGASGSGSVRIDHCHFDQQYQMGIDVDGWIYGVIDHSVWDVRDDAGGTVFSITANNGRTWGGGTNNYGDGSWADASYFGSGKFLFIETNTINNLSTAQTNGAIDCQDGGRYVNRFNCFKNCTMVSGHGTESGGRQRGERAIEHYKNIATTSYSQSLGLTRSGVSLYHNNTWTGAYNDPVLPLVNFRQDFPYHIFEGADGTDLWDVNDTEGNGTNVPGHSPHLYGSGTAASNTTVVRGNGTFTVSGNPGWTTNQLAGCIITNTTQTVSGGTEHPISRIFSNTSNTITFGVNAPDPPIKTFNTGDGFVCYKPLIVLDQPGRGECDLLANDSPINTTTGGIAWPHQALDPIYNWLNTMNGTTPVNSGSSTYPNIQENRDYYNQNSPFNGTAGIGVGTLAGRPSTCTPGVAYWATDQGEWDSTHTGPDGQLYVCTAPNSWSLYYKPYTYPHPLVSGAPSTPQNLRIAH